MGFKCGLIGLPNVGKSTLFNALTKSNSKVANFPFCTIEPNIGFVPIIDERLEKLAKIVNPQRVLPSTIKFIDIAGLVEGASNGDGLGNKILAIIRNVEVIGHVVRCFDNDEIMHVSGYIDPVADINTINTELILADLAICERTIYYSHKKHKSFQDNSQNPIHNKKEIEIKLDLLKKCLMHLESGSMLNTLALNKEEKEIIYSLNFLTIKPVIYIANLNKYSSKINTHYLTAIEEFLSETSLKVERGIKKEELVKSIVVPVCATATVADNIDKCKNYQLSKFMSDINIDQSRLNRVIRASYNLLNLHNYFTTGAKEVRSWTIPRGTVAQKAAGKIHTNFEQGFICAQIISYVDFLSCNGEQGAKKAGKVHVVGKKYLVQDGDVIKFIYKI